MTAVSYFYVSRVIGRKIVDKDHHVIGILKDIIVDTSFKTPIVVAVKVKSGKQLLLVDFKNFEIYKEAGQYLFVCSDTLRPYEKMDLSDRRFLFLARNVLDKQIVDINGKKVERVNDVRMAILTTGTYVVAVDVGFEGLLRRLGFAKVKKILPEFFNKGINSKLILWEDVETIDFSNFGIVLSKENSKLSTLHPSDLADIIEDLDKKTQVAVFSSLDNEKAADVLEELETEAQLHVLGSLSVEKAADVLENMPADEVADILDEMKDDTARELLNEMEHETSDEIRGLMDYPEDTVGSMMSTDYISFSQNMNVDQTIMELRRLKPEPDIVYYLYIVDEQERLVGTVSLRDIIISQPEVKLREIMNHKVIYVHDNDHIDTLTKTIAKYNLIALPVVDQNRKMMGMAVINDVVYNLLKRRKRA